ncbi:MAG: CcmD family protein [Bacteroidota bacterium]|jgi:CcmD family protein
MKKLLMLTLFIITTLISNVGAQQVEMADGLRSSGKIYVVVGVLCIIFAGIVVYLISIDRKLEKLKKEAKPHQHTL